MKTKRLFLFALFLVHHFLLFSDNPCFIPQQYFNTSIPKTAVQRLSSDPFISGDSFRAICNHQLDETKKAFYPQKVSKGDIIYVTPGALTYFFSKIHPKINVKYILLTHNSDLSFPGQFASLLNDDKLALWITTNNTLPDCPKMVSIPIGIANRYWAHGDIFSFNKICQKECKKKHLLIMNFLAHTNLKVRKPLLNYFSSKPFCYHARVEKLIPYLTTMKESYYVLSPFGNGLDCHRTWEALLLGAIPIVESSAIDNLFNDLPVLIVDSFFNLDKALLERELSKFSVQEFKKEKVFFQYWRDLIFFHRKRVINEE